jgi:oligoribonuclease
MHAPLLWADIESTGLDPHSCHMLEVALLLTDENLREIAHVNVVLGWRDLRHSPDIDPYVRQMHEVSGLWDEVEASDLCVRQAEVELVKWVEEWDAHGLYLAGSGVHFDRRWFRTHMPRLARLFHYRNFDLTTLRYFFGTDKSDPPHRALLDLRQNVADLRELADKARAAGLLTLPISQLGDRAPRLARLTA